MDRIFEAIESFHCKVDGTPTTVRIGQRVREGHPLLRGHEKMFRELEIQYEWETATAAPGEKRAGVIK